MTKDILSRFAERLSSEFPELRQSLDDAQAGIIPQEQALKEMSEIIAGNPELDRRFRVAITEAMALVVKEILPPDQDGVLVHKERGLPQLNPLVEAALIERAQFDDDMPELRTGGLPSGVRPAAIVDTIVRSPVAIGQMLNQASQQVAQEIAAREPERKAMIAESALLQMVGQAGTALATRRQRDLVLDGKSDVLDVPGYRRGQLPVPRKVTQPSGSMLLALTPAERKQSAWQFLSTTQGRRSAERSITQIIGTKLRDDGYKVKVRPFCSDSKGMILAAHQWSVSIDGPGSTQASFSIIDIAASVIAKVLAERAGPRDHEVALEVTALSTVDIRSVGWAGRLMSDVEALAPKE